MQRFFVLVPFLVAACSAQLILAPYGWPAVSQGIISGPVISSQLVSSPIVRSAVVSPIAVPTSSQYHAQDELGQFAFGHSSINQAREEVKSFDGTVRGAYSYVDPTGKLNNVQYLADSNGFRVLGANNLPVAPEAVLQPVKDTPEVLEARENFARAFKEAEKAAAVQPEEEKKEEAKTEEAKSRKRRQVLLTGPFLSTLTAKTILKTSELKPIDDAKVPASTKLAEIKETEKEILTPLIYSSPLITSSIVASSPIARTLIAPTITKTTVTTQELKPVEDAKTPANTKLTEIKEEKKDVLTPITYSAPLIASPYIGAPIISPYLGSSLIASPYLSSSIFSSPLISY